MQIMKMIEKGEGCDGCLVSIFQHYCNELKMSASPLLDQFMSPRETFLLWPRAFEHNHPSSILFFDDLCELIVNSPIRKLHNIKVTRD